MSPLFVRRSRGIFASIAVLGLVAACMQHPTSAPPPAAPAAPAPAASAAPPVPMVVIAKRAHFRDGPSYKAPIIGMIPAGSSAVLIGSAKDKWVQVSYQNRVGYVLGTLIKQQ